MVSKRKMWLYLLARHHHSGGGKARAFGLFGFTRSRWWVLANRLKLHARSHHVTDVDRLPEATKYVIKGILRAADGRQPYVVSVWKIPDWEDRPRLISAYIKDPPSELKHERT